MATAPGSGTTSRYLLPWPVAPLKPLVTAYVRCTQRREMRDLAALIKRDQSRAAKR